MSNNTSSSSDSDASIDGEEIICGIGALFTIRQQNRGNMIISHLNINSLPAKYVELLCISETKLNESHLQDFSIPQYRTYHHDRPPNLCGNGTGGGLITWVRGDMPSRRRPDLESENAETLCIDLNVKHEKWLIICCYNPHSSMTESYMKEFSTLVDKSLTQYKFITVIGDLNNNLLLKKCDVNKHLLTL